MNSFFSTFCRWKRELSDQFQTVVSRHPAIEFAFQLLIPGLRMFPKNKHDDVFGGLLGRSESRALSRWACGLSGQRNRGVHQSQHKEYSMAELPLERVALNYGILVRNHQVARGHCTPSKRVRVERVATN
jgi:hypothetical protein